jgi:hypothetical protein
MPSVPDPKQSEYTALIPANVIMKDLTPVRAVIPVRAGARCTA